MRPGKAAKIIYPRSNVFDPDLSHMLPLDKAIKDKESDSNLDHGLFLHQKCFI